MFDFDFTNNLLKTTEQLFTVLTCLLIYDLAYVTGVQQGLRYVLQLEIQDRSWMSFFVALLLTLGWASLVYDYDFVLVRMSLCDMQQCGLFCLGDACVCVTVKCVTVSCQTVKPLDFLSTDL